MALNDVVYNKTVDVAQSMPVPVVFAKQNENGKRKVIVTLLKNGQPFLVGTDISGYIQGATAPNPATKQSVRFKRDLTLIDAEGSASTVTFVIAESMTAEIGITQCEIALYDSTKPNEILCTANINIEVQGTGMSPQDEMASDDYQAIVSIKAEVTAMRDEVRTKTNQAIAAQAAAETAAQNAYNSALGVQKIVAGNEAYTKQETDLKCSVAPRKAQTSTTGELKLTDADYGLSYIELQGNSEQYTATGTNLFDVKQLVKNMQEINSKYITIGKDGDGEFMNILNSAWNELRCLEFTNDSTKSYRIGCKARYSSGNGSALFFIVMYKDGTYTASSKIVGQTKYTEMSAIIPAGKEIDYFYFSYNLVGAYYNILLDSFYLYPIDVPSSERPTGGYGTPSPEYPSEVKSVGDIPKDVNGVEIRNLLDEEWIKNQPESAWTKDSSGTIFSIEVALPKTRLYIRTPDFNATDAERTTFGISKRPGSLAAADGIYFYKTTLGSFDFSGQEHIYIILGRQDKNWDLAKKSLMKSRLMVTSAAEIDEYRPYIGENNGLVKIESNGINRADAGDGPILMGNGSNIEVNTWTPGKIVLTQKNKSTSWAYVELDFERGKTYTFYCKGKVEVIRGAQTDGITKVGFRQYPPSGIIHGQTMLSQDGQYKDIYNTTGVIPDDVPNMAFMIYLSSTSASNGDVKMTIDDLMVVEGEKTLQEMKALKYQPYHQQITWIPLREPLRKITGSGTYQDSIDQDGFVTQCILKCVLDGSKGSIYGGQTKEDLIGLSVDIESLLIASRRAVWCNKLAYLNSPVGVSVEGCAEANTTLTIIVKKARLESADLAGFKKWLSDQYSKGEPVIAYPATVTPIAYQIPAVYIETYDQETNIRCLNKVKPSDMTLDYKLAISSLIKRLEALETTAVQEVTRNV